MNGKNYDPLVTVYQPKLRKSLAERGWIVEETNEGVDIWSREIWTLASEWTPVGFRVHLVFEFDDLFESVAATVDPPLDHHSTHWECRLYLRRDWEGDIAGFLSELDRLRNLSDSVTK